MQYFQHSLAVGLPKVFSEITHLTSTMLGSLRFFILVWLHLIPPHQILKVTLEDLYIPMTQPDLPRPIQKKKKGSAQSFWRAGQVQARPFWTFFLGQVRVKNVEPNLPNPVQPMLFDPTMPWPTLTCSYPKLRMGHVDLTQSTIRSSLAQATSPYSTILTQPNPNIRIATFSPKGGADMSVAYLSVLYAFMSQPQQYAHTKLLNYIGTPFTTSLKCLFHTKIKSYVSLTYAS